MHHIENHEALQFAIEELENRLHTKKENLMIKLDELSEQLKPSNLILNSLHDITNQSQIGKKILFSTLGLGAAYVVKSILESDWVRPAVAVENKSKWMKFVTPFLENPQMIASAVKVLFARKDINQEFDNSGS
jgi:hypothetical protein